MSNLYTSGEYLTRNPSWHVEDSAWKAGQIHKIIAKNQLHPATIADLGCGAGAVLHELSKKLADDKNISFRGYDISPQAVETARKLENERLCFYVEDLLAEQNPESFDVLLAIDVFEHIPDYLGFLTKCKQKATYKIYHIPLDVYLYSVLSNTVTLWRYQYGHLHYFTADSALATLRDTGHEIVDFFYTSWGLDLFWQHPTRQAAVANVLRWVGSKVSVPLTARLLGGYSLLVLAK